MADPVSWLLIEPGWKVVTADGKEVGEVREIVGDTGVDIFDGLVVVKGLLRKPRYVPAEEVGSIYEGRVELKLSPDEFDKLGDYDEPPASERFLAP
jgi:uncharacterized protein YrrD